MWLPEFFVCDGKNRKVALMADSHHRGQILPLRLALLNLQKSQWIEKTYGKVEGIIGKNGKEAKKAGSTCMRVPYSTA